MVQMSTTHRSFDQYCISHKTISHRAAAAPGREVRGECPMTYFPALPLLATNPGDATVSAYLPAADQQFKVCEHLPAAPHVATWQVASYPECLKCTGRHCIWVGGVFSRFLLL